MGRFRREEGTEVGRPGWAKPAGPACVRARRQGTIWGPDSGARLRSGCSHCGSMVVVMWCLRVGERALTPRARAARL